MKLPEKMNVMGKQYNVTLLPGSSMEGNLGECWYRKTQIYIDSTAAKEMQVETLLHELLHAVSEEMGLNMKEKQVRPLSVALYQILQGNPKFTRLLCRQVRS